MKKLVSVIFAMFFTVCIFAEKWPLSYDEMLEEVKQMGIPYNEITLQYEDCDFDPDLQNFMVGVWYTYFPHFAYRYGVPFIAYYTDVPNKEGEIGHFSAYNDGGYFSIGFINLPYCMWADFTRKHLTVTNKDTMDLICHELTHAAEMLNGEKEYIRDHNGSTWNREFARLIVDYGIDIDYAKH